MATSRVVSAVSDWGTLPNFTSYFGTKLLGAEVTWYNNPSGSGTDLSELKFKMVQNLHARMYTWWDETNRADATGTYPNAVEDFKFFRGHHDIASNGSTANTSATQTPNDYAPADLVFWMQFKNPSTVSTAVPKYDGFWSLAYTTVTTGTDAGGNPTIAIGWTDANRVSGTILDLTPASDYDVTKDTASCASGTASSIW